MVCDRYLMSSFGVSVAFHIALITMAPVAQLKPDVPLTIAVTLVESARVEESKRVSDESQKFTPPRLLAKSEPQTKSLAQGAVKEGRKEPVDPPPGPATLPAVPGSPKADWNADSKRGEAGGVTGDGSLIGTDAGGVVGSSEGQSSMGGGHSPKGGSGGEPFSSLARPLGGYQVKPHYPNSARRAGAQGTTLLKLHVLANGRVGDVMIEQSAGHRDLDNAAIEAVKQWLFEPARMDKAPIAVWVLLPIKFELQ